MASASALWVARLRRERLLDLLEGRAPDALPVRPHEAAELRLQPGECAAVWRAPRETGAWLMPQALVVEEEGMADLFAWAATYLRSLGPLTAQTRVLSPARLLALTELSPLDLRPFLGGAVGLILCEVLMHARMGVSLSIVGASAARSTLSYALVRARRLGLPWHDLPEATEVFARLRREARQPIPGAAIDAVFNVAQAFLQGASGAPNHPPRTPPWLGRLLSGADTYELAEEILSRSGGLLGPRSFGRLAEMTAEERVRLLDDLAPSLLEGDDPRLDRAFALALACFVCRPGLEQQASLLAEYARRLPEAWLWLGVMQCRSPLAEVLSAGEGAGWWIARELVRAEDPFAPPRADIAAPELLVLLRGKSRPAGRLLSRGRIEVELLPMVSVMLRGSGDRAAGGEHEAPTLDIPLSVAPPPNERSLSEAERAIEAALRLIQGLRSGGGGGEDDAERALRRRKKR